MSDKMETPLPNSPHDMPSEIHNDDQWLHRTMASLRDFDCVDIHYEIDHVASEAAGEHVGKWEVVVESGSGQTKGKHALLYNALWYVFTVATHAAKDQYFAREKARGDALAKLTHEERKALGV